jgi:hypothetical protein
VIQVILRAMERVLDQKIKKVRHEVPAYLVFPHPKSSKVAQHRSRVQVIEARTDTPTMLEALQAIAVFYGQDGGNTADARKSLRQVRWRS